MNWFINTFLKSLEERYLYNCRKLWLTTKQVTICKLYMDYGNIRGNYHIDANGKRYIIQVAPNGGARFDIIGG